VRVTLSITIGTASPGQTTIGLHGDLDQTTAGQLRDAVADALTANPEVVRLDLAQLTFVDSAGLGALVRAYRRAAGAGSRLVLDGVTITLYERLEITGLADLLGVRPPGA
jgi:stage II sporulation protein AA (anti-sigma F factor antagonist)